MSRCLESDIEYCACGNAMHSLSSRKIGHCWECAKKKHTKKEKALEIIKEEEEISSVALARELEVATRSANRYAYFFEDLGLVEIDRAVPNPNLIRSLIL